MSRPPAVLTSNRLRYLPLSLAALDAFHALVADEHIRRYLLDGEFMDRAWCEQRVRASEALFAERGVGIWLVHRDADAPPVGFCGFIRFPETGPEPQLLYALTEPHTGQGYATEIAQALIDYVRQWNPASEIVSAVDEPNVASRRVLEKVGFQRCGESPGAFGRILHYRLLSEPRAQ